MDFNERAHLRFILRDQYGNAIQNARVDIYQPGTDTPFLGTAYDSQTGGNAVTNPFYTNAQGEVEAYFDTYQWVDLEVSDNLGTAKQVPFDKAITFSTFRERHFLFRVEAGEEADIAGAPSSPYTTVAASAGATGRLADAGHVHPFTALVPATPTTLFASSSAEGSSSAPARSDHTHGLRFKGPTSQVSLTGTGENTVGSLSIPGGSLVAGSTFMIVLQHYHTNSTTASTFAFRVKYGTTTLLSTALSSTTTAHTDQPSSFLWVVTFRAVGASGSVICELVDGWETITTTTSTPTIIKPTITSAVTVDTTTTKDLSVTVQQAASSLSGKVNVFSIWQVG
jgi:hypothetical protein